MSKALLISGYSDTSFEASPAMSAVAAMTSTDNRPPRNRLTPSRSYPISFSHQTPPSLKHNILDESKANEIEKLYWDGEDEESFEVPDFHFDWGVVKEKNKSDDKIKGSRLSSLKLSEARSDAVTPPPASSTPASQPRSAQSSSSAQVLSLTDASTVSASSLVPTPPADGISFSGRSSTSQLSGGSKHGDMSSLGRSYGARTFQRVVSAPLTRSRADESNRRRDSDDSYNISTTTSTIQSHTATLRPNLLHTSSSSSIHQDPPAGSTVRSFLTPGLTDRTLSSTAASTGRRLGGLSRFGGPARRVIPPPETTEEGEENPQSSALIGSPPEDSPPHHSHTSSDDPPRSRRWSPTSTKVSPPASIPEMPETHHDLRSDLHSSRHKPTPSTSALPSNYRHTAESEDRSAINNRYREQENRPEAQSSYRAVGKTSSLAEYSSVDRPPPQPLQPSHSIPSESQRYHEAPLRSTRPAPVNPAQEIRITTQTAPAMPTAPIPTTVLVPPQPSLPDQAMTQPAQPAAAGKRSFFVNGAAYERLGILGKGGSSKVYSVLCPVKREVFALKRVALDRADAETYQSYTNEIELLKRLKGHDRIIQLIDHQITFTQNNRPRMLMMVMECGEIDFAMLLDEQRGKPLNMNFIGLYWEQMLEAVHAVHQENVVHTDLKPANFVLVKGRLKIIDFGIAKAVANDTVNIQRDQQVGTVNYMSPEAIQRMNNQKVLKLSYPSDVWSLGCILFQMVYGSPPFQHIGGGPLPKMNAIANPNHEIHYPDQATPKSAFDRDGNTIDPSSLAVTINPAAIGSMRCCLAYNKDLRSTIPELLQHEFLRPTGKDSSLPHGTTSISPSQMSMLVNFVLRENGLPPLREDDATANDLFSQLQAQNSRSP